MNGSGDADQLADAFATAADNIVKNLAEIIPRFAETLPALAGAIVSQIPGLAAAIVPAVLSAGQSILEQARDAVTAFDFVAAAEDVVQKITDFISSDGLGSFLGCLVDIFTGIVNGISSMLPVLLPALVELIAYTVTTLIDQLPALLECALQLIIGLADGLLAEHVRQCPRRRRNSRRQEDPGLTTWQTSQVPSTQSTKCWQASRKTRSPACLPLT